MRNSIDAINDDASSYKSADDKNSSGITLNISKSHSFRVFNDRQSLESILAKKLRKIESTGFSSLDCSSHSLSYDACEYLGELIERHASAPIIRLNLEKSFCSEEIDEE